MQEQRPKIRHPLFVVSVVIVAAALAALAVWVSLRVDISPGVTLLITGVIVAGIGATLARPSEYDPENPRNHLYLNILRRQNEYLEDQETYDREHSAPLWGFEDVMVWAGLLDTLAGIVLFVLHT